MDYVKPPSDDLTPLETCLAAAAAAVLYGLALFGLYCLLVRFL